MPSEGRRLHGFTVVSRGLQLARQLLLPAIVGGASAGGGIGGTIQWILLILSVPSVVLAFAQWLAFRFRVEGDDLIIDSGVLARRRRVIPLARVQNIDLEQGLIERLAGVARLRLETASGGADTEASLAVLSVGEAHALQAEMMRRRNRARGAASLPGDVSSDPEQAPGTVAERPVDETAGPSRVLLRLGLADLAIAGATSNESGLIAAGLATMIQVAGDFGQWAWIEAVTEPVLGRSAGLGFAAAVVAGVVLAALFFVLGWVVSIAATLVRFHGFTLTRVGDDLRREYGLFSRHRSTVPLERVQAVRIEETLLRRPLGLTALKIETAGAGPGRSDQPGGRAEAFVPLARRRDVGRLLAEVFEDARFEGVAFQPVDPVSRRRSFTRLALPILVGTGILAVFHRGAVGLALLLLPAWAVAGAQYRARGWARASGYALARGGVLTRVTWVVPERKIQTLHLRESPFQRRWGVGTVMIDTAATGRTANIVDVRRETGAGLLGELAAAGEAARRAALSSSRAARSA